MANCESFNPSINSESNILILGSMPGIKSLEEQQYYAHPQNRFWKILGRICENYDLEYLDYNQKLEILLANKIALWDTIKYCNRIGSLDSNIQDEIPNDIRGLLKRYPSIKKICLNGNKSYLAFKKYFPELLDNYCCYKMPSTSPANAKFNLEKLFEAWRIITS